MPKTITGTVRGQAFGASLSVSDPPFSTKYAGDEIYIERRYGTPRTVLCFLHSWSGVYTQVLQWPDLKTIPDVVLVAPHFGGSNNHPQGAGHPAQLERIKRVIDKAKSDYGAQRVALIGYSGGGYAALMMLGSYPGLAQVCNAWLNIHDLAAWWAEQPGERAQIEACFGGPPAGREADYLARSPAGVLQNARDCDVWINSASDDSNVYPSHQVASFEMLNGRPGITRRWRSFTGGHVFQPAIARAQIMEQIG